MYQILLSLAGISIRLSLEYEDAYRRFLPYSRKYPGESDMCVSSLKVSPNDWTELISRGFSRTGQVEASYLSALCSDVLLRHRRCIIHAAAFRDAVGAWLITAPPGIGKSTQVGILRELFPGRYDIICGDRPVLRLPESVGVTAQLSSRDSLEKTAVLESVGVTVRLSRKGGQEETAVPESCDVTVRISRKKGQEETAVPESSEVTVHPSPWNGKEDWGGAEAAPLKGIICLRRGEANRVCLLPARNAGLPVYQAIIQTAAGREEVLRCAAFADALLQKTPVWDLVDRDIPGSTRLLYETVLSGNTRPVRKEQRIDGI